ncbi:DUF2786 domain-containing protein [Amycolatopsis nigrescens]|uniref:DUF2786 domain-containing protein n=1 Tax=Amycolatopsis nigrescens TaxID=381445 RepID=UPI00037A7332|nr:DUF2786 domain-containing protein [Amycolatopsis nigrescens]
MPDQDALLARVRKLLAKAEDPAVTEAEAELYNTKAAELIARHGIDNAMLAAEDRDADEITSVRISVENPYSRDKASLLAKVAHPLRCRAIFLRAGNFVYAVTVFGFRSDLERAQLLYTSLLLQATTQLGRVRPEVPWQSVAAYRRTWLHGFATAVQQRLTSAEQRAAVEHGSTTTAGRSTELVLRDRVDMVDEAYQQEYGDLHVMRRRRLSGGGYLDGHLAGRRADLGATPVSAARPGLHIT